MDEVPLGVRHESVSAEQGRGFMDVCIVCILFKANVYGLQCLNKTLPCQEVVLGVRHGSVYVSNTAMHSVMWAGFMQVLCVHFIQANLH